MWPNSTAPESAAAGAAVAAAGGAGGGSLVGWRNASLASCLVRSASAIWCDANTAATQTVTRRVHRFCMQGVGWSAVVLVFSAILPNAPAQPAEPSLNVTVRDSRGHVIRGLEAPDFAVTEDGAPATVRGVRFVESGKDPVHITVLFDHMAGEPARLSRDAALELLNAAGAH